jgi:hypothetical protein
LAYFTAIRRVQRIEVYKGQLISLRLRRFFNVSGICGNETFRGDLALMYFADLDSDSGKLLALHMVPLQIRRFRLNASTRPQWLANLLCPEGCALLYNRAKIRGKYLRALLASDVMICGAPVAHSQGLARSLRLE